MHSDLSVLSDLIGSLARDIYFTCMLKQARNEVKNYVDRGKCHPPKLNSLRNQHYSSHHTKAKFENIFVIYSGYFLNVLKQAYLLVHFM